MYQLIFIFYVDTIHFYVYFTTLLSKFKHVYRSYIIQSVCSYIRLKFNLLLSYHKINS